jgi:hemolysin III
MHYPIKAPVQPDQEWANALTHGLAAVVTLFFGVWMVEAVISDGLIAGRIGLSLACSAYVLSVFGTFLFSTLSHLLHQRDCLNTLRAYDQAMIYLMISGTYTPIIYRYASDWVREPLLWLIWIAAFAGFIKKVAMRYRINSIGTYTYLLLGWLPAIPLASHVPSGLGRWMLAGGVIYSIGVIFLLRDRKRRYFHAIWHLFVVLASGCHFYGIWRYCVMQG